jgi:hypothetical protein
MPVFTGFAAGLREACAGYYLGNSCDRISRHKILSYYNLYEDFIMQLENLPPDQVDAFLESASYVEPMINMGEKVAHFGIDSLGREFILIASLASDVAKLGFL